MANVAIPAPTSSSATMGVRVRGLIDPNSLGRWPSRLIESATREPAKMDAFDADTIENSAPPTITIPPTGPKNSLAAVPIADSVYSLRFAATTTSTHRADADRQHRNQAEVPGELSFNYMVAGSDFGRLAHVRWEVRTAKPSCEVP
ncbi:MAG: hypothetical protein OES69_10785 [Myxococcales bacterium]|nr:hypothetical protein [Myxococcales bacterium]MDH3844414.1 hypothetical protein [Myxococcales bacterium]